MAEFKQLTIFDFLEPEIRKGNWVKTHGKRVMFEDIVPGRLYIHDMSTVSMRWFKVVEVTRKTEDVCFMTDGSRTAERGYMMACKDYINHPFEEYPPWFKEHPERVCVKRGTDGWMYEVED